ncbi:homocysteine S-methyltransferase [bacterium]|nr:homocysteine S-methyltransferase [bacterium]
MNIIEKILQKQKVFILDGALGTQIQRNGHDVNDSLWSAKFLNEDTSVIKEVHKQYLEAGADCIITSSYQASIEGFLKKGFSQEKAIELIKLSINIAKEARDEFWEAFENKQSRVKPLVAASIGPYGAYLADGSEYTGDYKISDEELKSFHKKRLEIILETNPDILACETIPSFKEAKIICDLLKYYPNTSSWITFSAKDENYTNAGDDIKVCMTYFNKHEHISALGINCTAPQYIPMLIENIKSVSSKPIIAYPNGGSKYNPITKVWEKGELSPPEYAKLSHLWYTKGAKIIGGCCETTPNEIECIRKTLIV